MLLVRHVPPRPSLLTLFFFLPQFFLLSLGYSSSSSSFLRIFFSLQGRSRRGGGPGVPVTLPPPFVSLFFVTLSKTLRGGRHDYLVITLRLTQCDPPPLEKSCPRPCSHNYKITVTPLSYRFFLLLFLFLSLLCIPNIFIFCVFGELTVFLYFSGFLTAVLQTHARQRNLPVDSLSFCYQVLNDKWTNDELVHSESDVDFKRVAFQVRNIRGATCTEYS